MAQQEIDQGEHGSHGDVHLPDPSIWPLVVGLAFTLVGAALIWWQRDTANDLALVAVGAAAMFALFAAGGWAYEDSRMRAKAESGEGHGVRLPRYNQVVTFALAEGTLAAATEAGGVLADIEASDSALRDLDGFQDLRITVSPAETGPSQVLVETTWSGREQLASYDETRQTILDILSRHEDQIVPGSVQVFDMEVVRDTKDVSFRFGWGAAATILGSLLVFGFMVGAGLALFQEDQEVVAGNGDGNGSPPPPDPYSISAFDGPFRFDKSVLQAPPETEVTFTLTNQGNAPHNLAFYESEGGALIAAGNIIMGGETDQVTFVTPPEGTYYFKCDVHPEMNGTFEVTPDAPPPGGAPSGGGGEGEVTVTANNLQFDTDRLEATAGQPFTVTLVNEDTAQHNISFYESEGGDLLEGTEMGEIIPGGQSVTVTFTPAEPGEYYFQCDLHPQMNGVFVVN